MLNLVGDGRQGAPSDGPFNVIHVGAAAEEIPKAVWHLFYYIQLLTIIN